MDFGGMFRRIALSMKAGKRGASSVKDIRLPKSFVVGDAIDLQAAAAFA